MLTRYTPTMNINAQFRGRPATVRELAPVQPVTESWLAWIARNAKDLYMFQATYGITVGAALPWVNLFTSN